MNTKIANNLFVGSLVTVGFIAFLFIIFSVGGKTGIFSSTYRLFVKFKDVKGLYAGSEVSLSGLRIGVVKNILVSNDSKELVVELSISKRFQNQIRADSIARIKTQGVLGDKYIEITMGSIEQPIIDNNSFLKTSEIEDWLSRGSELVKELGKKFSEEGDVTQILKNLNILTKNLATITTDIRMKKGILSDLIYGGSGPKISATIVDINEIFKKINSGTGTLGALINDPTVYEDLKYLFGGARRNSVLKYFMKQFVDEGKRAPKD